MGAVEADLHDIAQGITDDIMRYSSIPLKCPHFEDGWKRIKTCDLKQIYPELCTSPISVSKAINPPGWGLSQQISMAPLKL